MNRLKMIINLLLGKDIIIYNTWNKEVLMIIGDEKELIKNRYDYDFINKEVCLKCKDGKVLFDKEVK